ncbi:MAG: AAA family ATPase [Candidatus Dojkabacteria bacterium]
MRLREKLVIDWEELEKEYQSASSLYSLERNLSKVFRLLAILSFVGINLIGILDSKILLLELAHLESFGVMEALLAGTFSMYAYSLYLGRDKNRYQDWDHLSLADLGEEQIEHWQRIEMNDFLDRDLYILLGKQGRGATVDLLESLFSLDSVTGLLERLGIMQRERNIAFAELRRTGYSLNLSDLEQAIERGFSLAYEHGFAYFDEKAFAISLLLNELDDLALKWGVTSAALHSLLDWQKLQSYREHLEAKLDAKRFLLQIGSANQTLTSVYSPLLEKHSKDLTQKIKSNLSLVDFSYRLNQLEEIDSHLAKLEGMILLVGEPGVGKSNLVRSFVLQLLAGEVSPELRLKRVLELNVTRLLSQMSSSSKVAAVLDQIFTEQHKSGDIILVIDDLDEVFSLPQEQQQEITAILSRQLQQKNIKLIATITPSNFKAKIEQNSELLKNFEVIQLPEPDKNEMIQILLDRAQHEEQRTSTSANYAALARIAELSPNYEFNRHLPDKALDLYKELIELAKERGEKFVSVALVDEYLAKKSNLNLGVAGAKTNEEQSQMLLNLESELGKFIVGQQEAISSVAKALRRARLNINAQNDKPVASFLFFGPTGVGKTEMAKTIARVYFGDSNLLFRLDMSQYQQAKDVEQLIGYTAGGKFIEGVLATQITRQPFSVILLDELEKANAKVVDLFLQILDNASVLDASGRRLDFANAIIIATSNAGSSLIAERVAAGSTYKDIKPAALERLKTHFRVEFLNRFDGVVMFHPLSEIDAERIAALLLSEQKELLKQKGIEFIYSDTLAKHMVEKGFDRQFGARSLKRTVTETISDEVAKAMLSGTLKPGDVFSLE